MINERQAAKRSSPTAEVELEREEMLALEKATDDAHMLDRKLFFERAAAAASRSAFSVLTESGICECV